MDRAINEYDTMMKIMSNYEQDEIEDCLEQAFKGDYDGKRCTIGDVDQ